VRVRWMNRLLSPIFMLFKSSMLRSLTGASKSESEPRYPVLERGSVGKRREAHASLTNAALRALCAAFLSHLPRSRTAAEFSANVRGS
jgi:hypothetical protein